MRTSHTDRLSLSELFHTREFRRRFISSFSEPVSSIIICSPFFDRLPEPFRNVVEFCVMMQRKGTEDIEIVTRPPNGVNNSMTPDAAKLLVGMGVKIFVRANPFYHVKMYHIEYERGYFRTFLGSANFTMGGFDRNTELVAELQGAGNTTACHREIARMRDTGGALTYQAWVAKGLPQGETEAI